MITVGSATRVDTCPGVWPTVCCLCGSVAQGKAPVPTFSCDSVASVIGGAVYEEKQVRLLPEPTYSVAIERLNLAEVSMGSPQRIEVRISFNDMMQAPALTERIVQRLRDAGVPLSMSLNPKSRPADLLVRGTLERLEWGAMNEHLVYVWTDTGGEATYITHG